MKQIVLIASMLMSTGIVLAESGYEAVLAAPKEIQLGQPLKVSVELRYNGEKPSRFDAQTARGGSSFQIIGPDGERLPLSEEVYSTVGALMPIQPGERVLLVKSIDLAEQSFTIVKEGTYEVSYYGAIALEKGHALLRSKPVQVQVKGGTARPIDSLMHAVRDLRSDPWWITKAGPTSAYRQPFGMKGPKCGAITWMRMDRGKSDVRVVHLWTAPRKLTALADAEKSCEYLGDSRFGHLYLGFIDAKAKGAWSTAAVDILRAIKD